MPTPIDLSFRAVIVSTQRNGATGSFRAVVPNEDGNLVLDLNSIMPGEQVRDIRIDDYAEISIRLLRREDVEATLAAPANGSHLHVVPEEVA